ncbi:leucine-rich repeat domain-containing protein [Duncaniella muris]|jgi:hypothetical protein|uniref:leucine-rich repeat domain-containing protein n=1 Tax=Duncaniella muris TaxID=2094150 RepID=UPI0013699DDA|nr:leucine-rich repeat domain-containing protein [Duncaniella muris]NBH91283.1 leucine-rich repeat domain-containing protein [Muribaculaceae bacterium S4]NBI19607.1 leucine-rich repeat domain-containing protein [Muribaculaceae bacterium Z1]
MKNLVLGRCVISFFLIFAVSVSAYAFKANGYEWEIIGDKTVRCDGFVWGSPQKIADIPAVVTNEATNKTYTNTYVYSINYCSEVEEIIVPETVKRFGDGTFRRNVNLKRIKLPLHTDMSVLPESMFCDCSSLQELTTPKADYDPENMLYGLSIPEKFCYGCTSLKKVVIPSECSYIANAAFQKCPNLKEFHIYATIPPELGNYVFFPEDEISARLSRATDSDMTLYVPDGCIESYRNSAWSQYFNDIKEVSDFSGINNIESDIFADDTIRVFDLNGRYVGNHLDALTPGLYIIRQGIRSRKTVIK